MSNFDNYLSPFTWRYGTQEMRHVWSENHKRKLWRQIWAALAKVQSEFGLISAEQVLEIESNIEKIDINRALEIESQIHHDLMAELKVFSEQCPTGGGMLHLGATSMDIEDNADALRLQESLSIILSQLQKLILSFVEKIEAFADTPIIAYTHIQPAEPTTLGYRFAVYAQDLIEDWRAINQVNASIRGKGFKGAVGTGAAYTELIGLDRFSAFEKRLSEILNLNFYPVATQTYPRKQDYFVLCALSGLGASLHKFAYDLRILQSPNFGELAEPFGAKQVGSSAMPFKRNPIKSEKIDSLSRLLAQMPMTAWQNAANSLLERTLDDSANRRTILPESFLICDELIITTQKIISDLQINLESIQRNLSNYAPFASTERVLMALANAGASRQEMHEKIREHAMAAWQSIQAGNPNPLSGLISNDQEFLSYLTSEKIESLLTVEAYSGTAPQRARELAIQIKSELKNH